VEGRFIGIGYARALLGRNGPVLQNIKAGFVDGHEVEARTDGRDGHRSEAKFMEEQGTRNKDEE
jgi:hypothetical protein